VILIVAYNTLDRNIELAMNHQTKTLNTVFINSMKPNVLISWVNLSLLKLSFWLNFFHFNKQGNPYIKSIFIIVISIWTK